MRKHRRVNATSDWATGYPATRPLRAILHRGKANDARGLTAGCALAQPSHTAEPIAPLREASTAACAPRWASQRAVNKPRLPVPPVSRWQSCSERAAARLIT
eukprot:4324937-Prymnesium_polylepis.1